MPSALSKPLPPPPPPLPPPDAQQAVTPSFSTASGTLRNMPYRIYSSPLLQEHKRYASQQNHSIRLPHTPESRRKHSLAPFSPYSGSPSSQSPMTDSNNGNSSTPRCPSRLSTSDEATTLENIWGSLFDEDDQPTARLGQLLRGLAMHIVRVVS